MARVDAYLASVKTLRANFSQVVRNRDGAGRRPRIGHAVAVAARTASAGTTSKPYLQTIVADGKQLWLYDSDLEQVTVRPLEQGARPTPAMLLSGSGKVGDAFDCRRACKREGDWTWCRLRPKQDELGLRARSSLAFDGAANCAAMELRDKLGQATRHRVRQRCAAIRRSTPRCSASSRRPAPTSSAGPAP